MPAGGFSASDDLEVSANTSGAILTIDKNISVRSLIKTGEIDLTIAGAGNFSGELAATKGTLKIDAGDQLLELVCDLDVAKEARMEIISSSATSPAEGRIVRLYGKTSGLGELYFGIDCSTNEICNANFNVMKAWTDKKNATFRVNSGATLGNVAGSELIIRSPITFVDSQTVVRSIMPYINTTSAIDQFPIGVSPDPSGEFIFKNCAITNALWFTNGHLVFDNCKARLLGVHSGISINLGSRIANDFYKEYSIDYFDYTPPETVTSSMDILEGSSVELEGALIAGNVSIGTAETTINISGGSMHCKGSAWDGADNSVKLAHWGNATTYFNMTGGNVYLAKRFCLCINGKGYFNMSGGTFDTLGFCLNGRNSKGGKGYMNFTGGTIKLRNSSKLHADRYENGTVEQEYEARLGGSGSPTFSGLFEINATAELTGETCTEAVNFEVPADSSKTAMIKRDLTGVGGFNKTGAGTLVVDAQLSCSGAVRVLEGELKFAAGRNNAMEKALIEIGVDSVLSYNGTTQKFGGLTATKGDWTVPAGMSFVDEPRFLVDPVDTASGKVVRSIIFPESMDVSNWTVCVTPGIADLNTSMNYVIAKSASGKITGTPKKQAIPKPWNVVVSGGELELIYEQPTVVIIR